MLADHVEPEGEADLEVIQRRSQSVIRLLVDTDTLMERLEEEREFDPIDLTAVVREEVASVADDRPAVTVESEIPDGLWAGADGLAHQLFSNCSGTPSPTTTPTT